MSANKQVKPKLRLELKPDGLAMLCENLGIATDRELAERIGINQSNLCRVRTGRARPGVPFVAGSLQAFGSKAFDTLFEIIDARTQIQDAA